MLENRDDSAELRPWAEVFLGKLSAGRASGEPRTWFHYDGSADLRSTS